MSTIVYKYRLWSPTIGQDVVDRTFYQADQYYNALVDVENHRRSTYRKTRSRIIPGLALLELELDEHLRCVCEAGTAIKIAKQESRSRKVPPLLAEHLAYAKKNVAGVSDLIRKVIAAGKNDPQLKAVAVQADAEADQQAKDLHSTLYWGTYMLVEDAIKRAKKTSPGYLAKKEEPISHRRGRIGIQIQGGITVSELLGGVDNRVKIALAGQVASTTPNADVGDYKQALLAVKARRLVRYQEAQDNTFPLLKDLRAHHADLVKQAKEIRPADERKAALLETAKALLEQLKQEAKAVRKNPALAAAIKAIDAETKLERLKCRAEYSAKVSQVSATETPRKKARGALTIRVGSIPGTDDPIYAEFPALLHRPLPADAIVTWAIVTRQPGHLLRPWIYHLCLNIETNSYARTVPHTTQEGTTAINFGWRLENGTLRIATLNNDTRSPEHVYLPKAIYDRFDRCKTLQSTIDEHFNTAKKELGEWIAKNRETLPPIFLESFVALHNWRSAERLSELVHYWSDHRVAGDEVIFPAMWFWRGRWFHLYQWCHCNYQRALRCRSNFYRELALRIVTTSAAVAVEDFVLSDVAEKDPVEEETEGGQRARENRTRACISTLRGYIIQAAVKHHCHVLDVDAHNNTRKCNVCGKTLEWDPAKKIMRDCPDCSRWDQDVNNTDNVHDRVASGEVVVLVVPAERTESGKILEARTSTFSAAREELRNSSI